MLVDLRGWRFFAFVIDPDAERIEVEPLQRYVTYRACTPHQVVRRWRKRHRRRVAAAHPPLGGDAQLTLPVQTHATLVSFPGIVAGDVVVVTNADRPLAAVVEARDGDRLHLRSCEHGRPLEPRAIDTVIGHYATPRRRGRRAARIQTPQLGPYR
ncbi:MAG: hypothetical protein AB7R77_24680 [Ilumatobacteraceae bacterium]